MVIVFYVWFKNIVALFLEHEENLLSYFIEDLLFLKISYLDPLDSWTYFCILCKIGVVSFIFQVDINLTQHHLLKMAPFLLCSAVPALSWMKCLYTCGNLFLDSLNSVPLFSLSVFAPLAWCLDFCRYGVSWYPIEWILPSCFSRMYWLVDFYIINFYLYFPS